MPYVNVKMAAGRSLEKKRQLAAAITADLVDILEVEPEWITVVIDEYPRDNWATAGELHADKFESGFGRQGTDKGK